jgi:hypothetical protein
MELLLLTNTSFIIIYCALATTLILVQKAPVSLQKSRFSHLTKICPPPPHFICPLQAVLRHVEARLTQKYSFYMSQSQRPVKAVFGLFTAVCVFGKKTNLFYIVYQPARATGDGRPYEILLSNATERIIK